LKESDLSSESLLKVESLRVSVAGKEILKGVDLELKRGEIHALMGPNGSGKSTLSNALLGHPACAVTGGRIVFKGVDVTAMPTDQRARMGMFLAFQYPVSIPGVSVTNFLRSVLKASGGGEQPVSVFRLSLKQTMADLAMDPSFAKRYLNEGFSGGEKKRCEILQLSMLKRELAILDEIDSGLDIDALRVVCEGLNKAFNPQSAFLVITHYQRMLDYLKPHVVHVLANGRIAATGGPELVMKLEKEGYESFVNK
jgi:Fe-S cluster assembly ATP-binding protein